MADTESDGARRDDPPGTAAEEEAPQRAADGDEGISAPPREPDAGPQDIEHRPAGEESGRADPRTRLTEARARLVEAQVRRAEVKAQGRTRRAEARERRARAKEELRARKLQIDEAAALRRHRLAAVMLFCGGGFAALFVALCLWFVFFGSAPQGEYAGELLRSTAIALAGGGALHLVLHAVRSTLRR